MHFRKYEPLRRGISFNFFFFFRGLRVGSLTQVEVKELRRTAAVARQPFPPLLVTAALVYCLKYS